MHNNLRRSGAIAILLIAGCEDTSTLDLPVEQEVTPSVNVLTVAREARTVDDFFKLIHEALPSFAGLVFEQGVPTVYLTDLGDAEAAKVALAAFLDFRNKHDHGFQARTAEYSWGELYNWRSRAKALRALDEMKSIAISTARNRLVLGVAEGRFENVRRRLAELGIPEDAVIFETSESVPLLANLRDRLRPVMGGYEIWGYGGCSAGFNVDWNGERALLTGSHCVQPFTSNTGWVVYQDSIRTNTRIGVEYWNPTNYGCTPEDEQFGTPNCLDADAALVLYDDSATWSFGHIARTTSRGQFTGSTTVDTARSRFWITQWALATHLLQGDTVHKIGKTTGWTTGEITDPCVDKSVTQTYPGSTEYWLICQTEVDAGAQGGDSGSPVFKMKGAGEVNLAGVLWGGYSNGPLYFSSTPRLVDAFGSVLDVTTGAPTLPFGVSISGPAEIRPGDACTWYGSVSGGTTPYAYRWTNDGHDVSDDDFYTGGKLEGSTKSSFTLAFTVTNDAGSSTDQLTVTEDSGAPICQM